MKSALFFYGGWDGHRPGEMAELVAERLRGENFRVDVVDTLDCLADEAALKAYDVISPFWTMGTLTKEQSAGLVAAVRSGVGLAGIHGGMGDAFRGDLDFEWMVGGHFVGHPHVGDYTVRVTDHDHAVTRGLPTDFAYTSEQYYLLTDPGNTVLAETDYVFEGRTVVMPVAWVKHWGEGRVFYHSLGHAPEEFAACPVAMDMAIRGMVWAARGDG